jgi:multicomponent Na+:H+ antiporter subunit D
MRAWNLSFWREENDSAETLERIAYLGNAPAAAISTERRTIPKIMTAATAGMVAVTLSLTVFAGPLLDLCLRAGERITEGVTLVQLQDQVGEQ